MLGHRGLLDINSICAFFDTVDCCFKIDKDSSRNSQVPSGASHWGCPSCGFAHQRLRIQTICMIGTQRLTAAMVDNPYFLDAQVSHNCHLRNCAHPRHSALKSSTLNTQRNDHHMAKLSVAAARNVQCLHHASIQSVTPGDPCKPAAYQLQQNHEKAFEFFVSACLSTARTLKECWLCDSKIDTTYPGFDMLYHIIDAHLRPELPTQSHLERSALLCYKCGNSFENTSEYLSLHAPVCGNSTRSPARHYTLLTQLSWRQFSAGLELLTLKTNGPLAKKLVMSNCLKKALPGIKEKSNARRFCSCVGLEVHSAYAFDMRLDENHMRLDEKDMVYQVRHHTT